MLPVRSILIRQKLVENAKIEKIKYDILSFFQTLWFYQNLFLGPKIGFRTQCVKSGLLGSEIDAFTPRSSQGWSGEKWYPFSDNKSSTNATSIAPASRRARVKNFEKNEVGNAHWRDEGCCLSLPLVFKAFIHTEEPYDDHQDRLLFLNGLDYLKSNYITWVVPLF